HGKPGFADSLSSRVTCSSSQDVPGICVIAHTLSSFSSDFLCLCRMPPGRAAVRSRAHAEALLGQHYTETHYSSDGSEITEKPDTQVRDHCFYQGRVRGHPGSAASISTCNGLRAELGALLTLEDPPGSHPVGGSAAWLGKLRAEPCFPLAFQKSGPIHKGPRYVELVLVADNQEVKWAELSKLSLGAVSQLYQPLRLRVALIGLEVWNHRDKITVRWGGHHPATTLGVDFHGNTVGLAKKLVMCTRDSGGVNQDHSTNPIGAASTMAHEMGHNLGMSHDEDVAGCRCPISKADGGCVMAGSLFSRCSEQDMWQFLGDPRTSCLLNAPRADELYGGPVCGNQFVERGEQCDCGTPEECSDRCCNATTCQLRAGAECARGECCQDCKVKAAGALCRASKNDCDLAEHCSGLSAECPEDVFQENGVSCQHGSGYCYNGACPSHGEQCRALWGAGTAPCPPSPLRDVPGAPRAGCEPFPILKRGHRGRGGSVCPFPCDPCRVPQRRRWLLTSASSTTASSTSTCTA
uniref:ADAM metallopeptidase domain 8 n=1 Tax=Malurus cyaneus samueli TaxID=2593467 RepID=A0A8C5TZR4_9PASS